MNGDVLTDLNYADFYNTHISMKNNFSIASYRRKYIIDFGVLKGDLQNHLVQFEEKPSHEFLVSMGVYMVCKDIIGFIPKNTFFGFDHLMNLLIEKSANPFIYEHTGRWLDIGSPDDYEKAVNEFDESNFL